MTSVGCIDEGYDGRASSWELDNQLVGQVAAGSKCVEMNHCEGGRGHFHALFPESFANCSNGARVDIPWKCCELLMMGTQMRRLLAWSQQQSYRDINGVVNITDETSTQGGRMKTG